MLEIHLLDIKTPSQAAKSTEHSLDQCHHHLILRQASYTIIKLKRRLREDFHLTKTIEGQRIEDSCWTPDCVTVHLFKNITYHSISRSQLHLFPITISLSLFPIIRYLQPKPPTTNGKTSPRRA